jgi:hypothetical protein
MEGHDRLLAAFLAGELDPAAARRWDEHLLECEKCWRAVREDRAGRHAAALLRQPVPPGLADRVAFAVEVAATGRNGRRDTRPHTRPRWRVRLGSRGRWRLAGAGMLAVGAVVTLLVLLFPGGHQTGSVPAAVAAVARYAQAVPFPDRELPSAAVAPAEMGRPVTLTADGQRIVVRTWRLGGIEAVVAVSARPFPMPGDAQGVSGMGMAWSARLGKIGLYCVNGQTSELVAAPVPEAELAELVARLPPA